MDQAANNASRRELGPDDNLDSDGVRRVWWIYTHRAHWHELYSKMQEVSRDATDETMMPRAVEVSAFLERDFDVHIMPEILAIWIAKWMPGATRQHTVEVAINALEHGAAYGDVGRIMVGYMPMFSKAYPELHEWMMRKRK